MKNKLLNGALGAALITVGGSLMVKGWSGPIDAGSIAFLLGSGVGGSGVVVLKKGLEK